VLNEILKEISATATKAFIVEVNNRSERATVSTLGAAF
jgi:hypothetical protein